jgi:protein-tyrosine kinase
MDRIRQALDRAREERATLHALTGARPTDPSAAAPQRPDAPPCGSDMGHVGPAGADGERLEVDTRAFDVGPLVLARNRIVVNQRSAPAARAFRMLRTQVLQRMRERNWRTLGVVSARSGDGKTTTAVNLALAIASGSQETALLGDLDLSRPGVASTLGLSPEAGVEDVLLGRRAISECLYRPRQFERFVLLPARAPIAGSSELVASARCRSLVTELRAQSADRIVMFDLPPVLEADDASAIAPLLDCLLFVVAEGVTAREDVTRGLELLIRTPVVGTVLNRSLDPTETETYG